MGTVNNVIAGINLVDARSRAYNPGLVFQVIGTHWILELTGEVQKFAEEDILLIMFDVFFNAGYELKHQYDQTLKVSESHVLPAPQCSRLAGTTSRAKE
jgi:hypothetical protein